MNYRGVYWDLDDDDAENVIHAIHNENANNCELVFDFISEDENWTCKLTSDNGVRYEGEMWERNNPENRRAVSDVMKHRSDIGDLLLIGSYNYEGRRARLIIQLELVEEDEEDE